MHFAGRDEGDGDAERGHVALATELSRTQAS
jgi:hypothetical protein